MDPLSGELATLTASRERALAVCLHWLSLSLIPIWATLLGQAVLEHVELSFILVLIACTCPLPLLYWSRERLGFALTTKLSLLILVFTTAYVEKNVGFTPTAALMCLFSLLLATLLLGDKTFPVLLVATVMMLAVGWLLYSPEDHPYNAEKLVDPTSPFVWVRYALGLGFLSATVRDWARNVRLLGYEGLLNDLGGVLASSLDAEQTLREVSRRVVLHFADFCWVNLLEEGQVKRAYAAARDPATTSLANALASFPPDNRRPRFGSTVLQTGKPELAKVTPEYLDAHGQDAEHLALLQRMGARSIMTAPVVTFRGIVLGSLTAASSSRVYDREDQRLLMEVARRAAMAIDNASLYADLRRARDEIQAQLHELEEAHQRIRTLTGLLPICAWCGRIRDEQEQGQWRRFDEFVTNHTPAEVTHGICPDCAARLIEGMPAPNPRPH